MIVILGFFFTNCKLHIDNGNVRENVDGGPHIYTEGKYRRGSGLQGSGRWGHHRTYPSSRGLPRQRSKSLNITVLTN